MEILIELSIIIPTHIRSRDKARQALRRRCLNSILRQDYPLARWELLIVSNLEDSDLLGDGRFSGRVLTVGKVGVNRARNAGARASKGRFLLFLDDDCELGDPGYLGRLVAMMQSQTHFSAIGGTYTNPVASDWTVRGYNQVTGLWLQAGLAGSAEERGPAGVRPCANLLGGHVCFQKNVFEQGYLFPEAILHKGDETALLRQLRQAQHHLGYCPSLEVIHHAASGLLTSLQRAWLQGIARAQYRLQTPRSFGPGVQRIDFNNVFFLMAHMTSMRLGSLYWYCAGRFWHFVS